MTKIYPCSLKIVLDINIFQYLSREFCYYQSICVKKYFNRIPVHLKRCKWGEKRMCLPEFSAQVWQLDRWVDGNLKCLARGHKEETWDLSHPHLEYPLWAWWWWSSIHSDFVHSPVRGKNQKLGRLQILGIRWLVTFPFPFA